MDSAKKSSKKEMILEVAAEHFSRYGYDATHLEAIAISSSIFRHSPDSSKPIRKMKIPHKT